MDGRRAAVGQERLERVWVPEEGTGWMRIDKSQKMEILAVSAGGMDPGTSSPSQNNPQELQSRAAAVRGCWPELSQLGGPTRESWKGLVGRALPAPLCPREGRDTCLGVQLPWHPAPEPPSLPLSPLGTAALPLGLHQIAWNPKRT